MTTVTKSTNFGYQRIHALARLVPAGQVATYGQLARLAGCRARTAGYAMAGLAAGTDVPWHRVVNARGAVSERRGGGGGAVQRRLLEAEGHVFDARGRLGLDAARWPGPGLAWLERHGYDTGLPH